MRRWWQFWKIKEPIKWHNGECDKCTGYGMLWLGDGQILCWDHYCEEMKRIREAK